MKELIAKLMRRPWVAHLLAANERFGKRLGPQFAGAVTYFSVLSMIPVLMFAVAFLGLTVTVLRPDLLGEVQDFLTTQLAGLTGVESGDNKEAAKFAKTISDFVTETFNHWAGIGAIALLAAAYSGSNWVKNLKHAVRAMWKDKFADAAKPGNFVGEIISNLLTFFGLLLSVAVAVGVTAAGQAFPEQIIQWLGLAQVPGIGLLLQAVGLVVSLLASWMLFAFLFVVLPGESTRLPTFLKATIAGAVLITGLQRLTGVLVGVLSGNRSAGIFGPIIILMIVFNLLATIILMLAAWVGTADTWEAARTQKDAHKAAGVVEKDEVQLDDEEDDEVPMLSPVTVAARHRAGRWAASIDPDDLRAVNYDPDRFALSDPDATVSQDNAARSVRVGLGVGYGVGAATGIGLGAAVAALVRKLAHR
ncbi:MAG: YhjD/YihY/BrkB family envelope integrity protein [Arachnia sp.]